MMREMHKWKDKAEFSLDNRQIFFLFFGLSVIGCFVFALGVMVGRRVELPGTGEVAALSDPSPLLEGLQEEPELAFKDGLRSPGTEGFPPTRDPSPAANEAATVTDQADADAAAAESPDDEPVTKPQQAAATPARDATSSKRPSKAVAESSASDAGDSTTLASSESVEPKAAAKITKASVDPNTGSRRFTLQMKAFARAEEAEAFAGELRGKGHEVRVESHEVRGRLWHRVRLGSFATWDSALAAKGDFESSEHVIAYVVRE